VAIDQTTQQKPGAPPIDKAALDRAFTELYKDNLKDVYSFLYYRLGNHHDAEDVSEQVFLQAYRHLPKALAESEGRSLRPWLIRIAQNLAINLYRDRSRKPQSPLDAAGEFADRHDTADLVESREELAHVFEKVAELGDDRREALIMRFALGMDNHEIARAMGKTEGATKVLLHRANKQLEEQLSPEQTGEDS
jgi:RNA polymerase sigma-70 factor (ECF subfamily)